MATKEDYAALSAIVYNNARGVGNKLVPETGVPPGWTQLDIDPSNSVTGFSAGAFINTKGTGVEIFLTTTGTEPN